MKKILTTFFVLFFLLISSSYGENEAIKATITKNVKQEKQKNRTIATVKTEFDIDKEIPEYIEFQSKENLKIAPDINIPEGSNVRAKIGQYQVARRWHKSGYIVAKLTDYDFEDKTYNLEDKNRYFVIRKYEKVNKKEAAILATEIVATQGASLFAPGSDIAYFFTKGIIQREKHPNWFKAGVMNAYDNSLLWFGLKGKPVNLASDDEIKVQYIDETTARNMKAKMDYRHHKKDFKQEKRLAKAEIKNIKTDLKREKQAQKYIAKHKMEYEKFQEGYLITLQTMINIAQVREKANIRPAARINIDETNAKTVAKSKSKTKNKAKSKTASRK